VKLWIDHQLSPYLKGWLEAEFDLEMEHVRELELHEAEDPDIGSAPRMLRWS